MKLIFLILFITLCACTNGSSTPSELNNAPCPIVLVAKSKDGVLLRDGSGDLYHYAAGYFFAKTIIASDLSPGEELSSNCK